MYENLSMNGEGSLVSAYSDMSHVSVEHARLGKFVLELTSILCGLTLRISDLWKGVERGSTVQAPIKVFLSYLYNSQLLGISYFVEYFGCPKGD